MGLPRVTNQKGIFKFPDADAAAAAVVVVEDVSDENRERLVFKF